VESSVQERELAEAGARLDPEIRRGVGPPSARHQYTLARFPVDQQEGEEVVAERRVLESLDDRPADLPFAVRRRDGCPEPKERCLPQRQIVLARYRVGRGRGGQDGLRSECGIGRWRRVRWIR
jgi:hypothetical protein